MNFTNDDLFIIRSALFCLSTDKELGKFFKEDCERLILKFCLKSNTND